MALNLVTRHTRLPARGYRQTVKEVIVYANEMYGRPQLVPADPTPGVYWNSPYQSFASGAWQGISADIKIPRDRVLGTDARFKLVYYIPTPPGGRYVLWRLDFTYWPSSCPIITMGVGTIRDRTPNYFISRVTEPYIMLASTLDEYQLDAELEQPVDIQLGISRWGTNIGDNEPSAARLLKLIMEYQGYE